MNARFVTALLLIAATTSAISPFAFARTVLDSTGGPFPTSIYSFGEPTTATFGQSFTVPVDDNIFGRFTFYLDDILESGHDFAEFQAYVYAWDEANRLPTGPALYTSPPVSSTNNHGHNGPEAFNFRTGGLPLTPGGSYIFFASAINQFDGDESFANSFGQTTNTYPGGEFFYSHVETFDLLMTNKWGRFHSGNIDWDFKAVFVPEPASLVPAALALAGLRLGRAPKKQ